MPFWCWLFCEPAQILSNAAKGTSHSRNRLNNEHMQLSCLNIYPTSEENAYTPVLYVTQWNLLLEHSLYKQTPCTLISCEKW